MIRTGQPPSPQSTQTAWERSRFQVRTHGEPEFDLPGTQADPWEVQGTGKGSLKGQRSPPLKPSPRGSCRASWRHNLSALFVPTLAEDQAWWLSLSTIDHPSSFRYFPSLAF